MNVCVVCGEPCPADYLFSPLLICSVRCTLQRAAEEDPYPKAEAPQRKKSPKMAKKKSESLTDRIAAHHESLVAEEGARIPSLSALEIARVASGGAEKVLEIAAARGARLTRGQVTSALATATALEAAPDMIVTLTELAAACPGPQTRGAKPRVIGETGVVKIMNRDKAGQPKAPRIGMGLAFWPWAEDEGARLTFEIGEDFLVFRKA